MMIGNRVKFIGKSILIPPGCIGTIIGADPPDYVQHYDVDFGMQLERGLSLNGVPQNQIPIGIVSCGDNELEILNETK